MESELLTRSSSPLPPPEARIPGHVTKAKELPLTPERIQQQIKGEDRPSSMAQHRVSISPPKTPSPLIASLQTIVGPHTKQAMVYGFKHTRYNELKSSLRKLPSSPIKKIFDNTIGKKDMLPLYRQLEGHEFEGIPTSTSARRCPKVFTKATERECKTALTHLILENFKRKKTGLPLIPLIFCTDMVSSKTRPVTPHDIATKRPAEAYITHSELRRLYKHCKEFEHDENPLLRELAQVAQETVHFVQVDPHGDEKHIERHTLLEVPPIWDDPTWASEWETRMETDPELRREEDSFKQHKWRDLVLQKAQETSTSDLASPEQFEAQSARYRPLIEHFLTTQSKTDSRALSFFDMMHVFEPDRSIDEIAGGEVPPVDIPPLEQFVDFLKSQPDFSEAHEHLVQDPLFERLYAQISMQIQNPRFIG